jgi:stearoyl-CoA desaturase (Delta-9 desaturase)
VPTAAAIAIATVNSPAVADQMLKKEGPAMHKDLTGQTHPPAGASGPGSGA